MVYYTDYITHRWIISSIVVVLLISCIVQFWGGIHYKELNVEMEASFKEQLFQHFANIKVVIFDCDNALQAIF